MTSAVVEGETVKELSGACSRRATRHRRDHRVLRLRLKAYMTGKRGEHRPAFVLPLLLAPLPSKSCSGVVISNQYESEARTRTQEPPPRLAGS